MKCQSLFYGKNKKNNSNGHLLKILLSMLNIKPLFYLAQLKLQSVCLIVEKIDMTGSEHCSSSDVIF